MPIVNSTHTVGHEQIDGRRYVVEQHTDDLGAVLTFEYLAAPGTDYVAVRGARVAQINDALAEAEAQALIDDGA